MEEEPKNLPAIIEKSGISTEQAKAIQQHFEDFLKQVDEWSDKAYRINVTDPGQKDLIAEAKKAYTIVRNVRLNAETVRKELKEESLRKGKLIDGIANFVKDRVTPIEEHLYKQVKFVELKEKEDLAKKVQERSQALLQYVTDISIYNLETMTEEAFQNLLNDSKTIFDKKKAEQEELEKKQKEKEEADRIENERIRKENEALKVEQDKKDAEIKKEREAKEALEKIERDRKEADEKAKHLAEQKRQAELAAPDKEKLEAYASAIKSVPVPQNLSTKGALEIVKATEQKLLAISQFVQDSIKQL